MNIGNTIKQIAAFTKKGIFSVKKHNEVVNRLNPLLNARIAFGESNSVVYGDDATIYQIDQNQVGNSAIGSMNYRGTYNNTLAYTVGDVVRVLSGSSQGIWVCVTAQAGGGTAPLYPESGTPPWEMLAFGIGTYHYKDPTDCSSKKVDVNMGVPTTDP